MYVCLRGGSFATSIGSTRKAYNMLSAILNFFNNVQGWFVHLRLKLGNILIGNTTVNNYHTELIIVCSAIEDVYQKRKSCGKKPEELSVVKSRIKTRMKSQGIEDQFHSLLKQYGLVQK